MSKTKQAADMARKGGSVRAAARHFDVSESAVYAELHARDAKAAGRCHCCGQPLDAAKKERAAIIDDVKKTIATVDRHSAKYSILDNLLRYLTKH